MPTRTLTPGTDVVERALVLDAGQIAAGRAAGFPLRREGPAKLTGEAKYTDDIVFPGAWYGATIRSTEPRAKLIAIEPDPDVDWSKVVVVTAADIPGENIVSSIKDDQPVLVPVGGEIRHVAEPVALLAAPDRETLRQLKGRIKLVTEALPPVFDPERSRPRLRPVRGQARRPRRGLRRGGRDPGGRVPRRAPGAAVHREQRDDRRARRGRRHRHPRLDAVPVLRPQGAQARAEDQLGPGAGHPGGDRRRVRRQGGLSRRSSRCTRRCSP